jgi:hypothetical protein
MKNKFPISINNVHASYKRLNKEREKSLNQELSLILREEKLPIIAYLIGKVMGDGHLGHSFMLSFSNDSKDDLINLEKLIIDNFYITKGRFKIEFKIAKGTAYVLSLCSASLGRVLFCLGAPKGNKVKQSFFIPGWIKRSKLYTKMFLMVILEDELATIKIEKKNHSIKPKFKMSKDPHLIEDLRKFLQEVKESIEIFGVNCSSVSKEPKSKLGQNTEDLYFDILRNKRNIIKFQEEIGFFLNQDKKVKLKECCEILKDTLKPLVDKEKILILRKRGLSIRQIAKKIHHGRTTVHRTIKQQQQSLNNNN